MRALSVLLLAVAMAMAHAAMKLGGVSVIEDLSDEGVQSAARAIVREANSQQNGVFLLGLKSVVSGTKQVVAGMKYDLVVEAAPTSCTRADAEKLEAGHCSFSDGAPTVIEATVHSQPWMETQHKVTVKAMRSS